MDEGLRERIDRIPRAPGVYLFKDKKGKVVYVGKARDLRARVRSYFQAGRSDERFFIRLLDHVLGEVETVVTTSEKEALLLENTLIKEHQPRYNIKLRDDKDFLHLRLDLEAEWPRLELVRRPKREPGALLFGPYHTAGSARKTMLLASKHFKLRTCKDSAFRNRTRPCMLYQLDRCPGPCVLEVDRQAYLEQARAAGLFLAGKHAELLRRLRASMAEAAAALAFERAALYRDQIRAVEAALAAQHVVELADVDRDVLGLARDGDRVALSLLVVRDGKIVDRRLFLFAGQEFPEAELVSSFVGQYYEAGLLVPAEVLLPVAVEEVEALAALLSERAGRAVGVRAPQRGRRAALVRLAAENAAQALAERRPSSEDRSESLARVARRLGLAEPPRRIECVDVAHHGGDRAVAAVAVLVDGEVAPDQGRTYNVKTAEAGDDYGSMYEVLSRRFRRVRDGEPGWEAPDLLVLDGGRGQLGVAEAAARDVGLPGLAMVALAKERPERPSETTDMTVDRVYLPGRLNPISVRPGSPLLLLARARDEAHRLAGKQLRRQKTGRAVGSALEAIPGVGPRLRTALLRHFGSLRAVRAASVDELRTVPGVGARLAETIHEHLGRGT